MARQGQAEHEHPRPYPRSAPTHSQDGPSGVERRAVHCPRAPPAGLKVRGRSAEGPVEPPRYGDPRRSERCRRRRACALQSRRQGERTADVRGAGHSPGDRLRVRPGVGLPGPPGLQPRRADSCSTAADWCALDAIYRPGGARVQALYRQERAAPAPVERSGALILNRRRSVRGRPGARVRQDQSWPSKHVRTE